MKGSSILIVEDEMIIAMEIRATLKKLGYNIAGTVISGFDAIQVCGEKHPDLVLMDIRLKGDMDGIEAAKKIMDLYDIPVIFLTGNSDKTTVERAVSIKPAGFLIKPFKERELFGNIEMAIHKTRVKSKIDSLETNKAKEKILKKISLLKKPFIATDKNGVITHANTSFIELVGEDNKIVGRKLHDIFSTPAKPEKINGYKDMIYFWPDSIEIENPDSTSLVYLRAGFILDESRDIQNFIFSVDNDIKKEPGKDIPFDEFTGLIDSFSEVIFITDISMKFVYYNNSFLEFSKRLGVSSFQLTKTIYELKEFSIFVSGSEYVEVFRTNHSIVKTKKLKSKGREINYFRVSLIPSSKNNQVTHVTTIIEDITSLVNQKEHDEYISQNLEEIKNSLSKANSIVYEINKPLMNIMKVIGNKSSPEYDKIVESAHEIEEILERFNIHKIKYEEGIDHIVYMSKTADNW